jgi:FKBP-type peptidyl-prolyl cis-trans isomerase 2
MALKKNDFVEIEFTGRVKDGDIFDSNIKEDLKNTDLSNKAKPFIFSLGQGMFLKGVDDFLIGKEVGKHKLDLTAEDAFGKRDPKFIQRVPMKVFKEQNLNPIQGFMFNFDGKVGKILAVSGGRVIVDFNNPVAGKDVTYDLNVLRKVEKQEEKIKSFIDFLFKQELKFEIKEKKLIIEIEKQMIQFVEMFKDKFKEIFDLDLEVKESKKIKSDENKEKDHRKSQ